MLQTVTTIYRPIQEIEFTQRIAVIPPKDSCASCSAQILVHFLLLFCISQKGQWSRYVRRVLRAVFCLQTDTCLSNPTQKSRQRTPHLHAVPIELQHNNIPDPANVCALEGVNLEHRRQQLFGLVREVRRQREDPSFNFLKQVGNILVVERKLPAQQRVQDDPARPNIHLGPCIQPASAVVRVGTTPHFALNCHPACLKMPGRTM